ncbi:O-antigen ligase family protein [Flavobacterium sp. 17A]|uniref:O-antigen ligase family protein n=1 Tax=Flavobacterium potami TaxID=2872310 RepID=A0A9X1KTA4_9FLAO|nr:O-antigen ligase family protein [Flavobacterium potami]MBZ4036831.1 O-antigen ligase family protein [Flavobacterium potami]
MLNIKMRKNYLNSIKLQESIIFVILVLLFALKKSTITTLPFLNGKYIYWLFAIIIGTIYFVSKKSNKEYVINKFDVNLFILFSLGLYNFNYISNATVFNINAWYFAGYLILYLIFRQILIDKGTIYKTLDSVYYFLALVAIVNGIMAILQSNNLIASENEYFKSTGLFYSPNHLGLFLVLGFISIFSLLKKSPNIYSKIFLYSCQMILLFALYLSQCRGAYLALGTVFLFYVITSTNKNKANANWKMVLLSSIFILISFLILNRANTNKEESALGRIFILKTALKQIENKKLFGNGFDSFSLEYNLAKSKYFEKERSWNETKNASYIYNASNDFLELTFNLGIIWILFFIFFIIKVFCLFRNSYEKRFICSIILCLIIFALTNTVLPIPLFIIIGCFFSVCLINLSEIRPYYILQNNSFFRIISVTIASLFVVIIFLRINAEYKLFQLYNGITKFSNSKVIAGYASKIDAKGEANFMAGIILLKNNNPEKGINYLVNGFKQSGKPTLGKNLAHFFERMGRYNEAEKIYIYNKNVEPFRFEARMDLFNLYLKTNQKEKARNTAKEIYDLPIKIPSKKIESLKEKAKNYFENEQKKAV